MTVSTATGGDGRPSTVTKSAPLVYSLILMIVAAVFLPTALRPPPDEATSSAEFSPDAPPEEDPPEAIISSLNQATSTGAGSGTGAPVAGEGPGEIASGTGAGESEATAPAPVVAPTETKPSKSRCVGTPPRQVESLYAAPCAPGFQGDNGGSTWKHVTGDEVRIGFAHSLGNAPEGPIKSSKPESEGSEHRTLRVLQEFFNRNFELYGRRVQLVQMPAGTDDPVQAKNQAVKADVTYKLFASYNLSVSYCDEMARRELVTVCNQARQKDYDDASPYLYSWMMSLTQLDQLGAEYICKKLVGKPAAFAGGLEKDQPRKIGLLYVTSEAINRGRTFSEMDSFLRKGCDFDAPVKINIRQNTHDEAVAAVAAMRREGVTTIVCACTFLEQAEVMGEADSSAYAPEWLLFGNYGMDLNGVGRLMPQGQMIHAFGLSGWELPGPARDTDCWRAYKSIDPDNDPNITTCDTFYPVLQQMVNGISLAGPTLTPQTFRDGLYRMGHRYYPQKWAIGGGFGPGDHSYMDNVGEIWWDATATAPEDGSAGAFKWVRDGQRYRVGEIPKEDPLVFQNGTASRPKDGMENTR